MYSDQEPIKEENGTNNNNDIQKNAAEKHSASQHNNTSLVYLNHTLTAVPDNFNPYRVQSKVSKGHWPSDGSYAFVFVFVKQSRLILLMLPMRYYINIH